MNFNIVLISSLLYQPQTKSATPINSSLTINIDWSRTTLIANSFLESIDLAATTWRSLCCKSCGVAFPPDNMLKHLKNANHRFDKVVVDKELFKAALEICHILPELPSPPTTLIPPVAGLLVQDGYECCHCDVMASTIASIKQHYKVEHKNQSKPTVYQHCHMQRFNATAGPSRIWFKVNPPTAAIPARGILDQCLMDVENQLGAAIYNPNTLNDPRTISPWLLSTKWHEEVEGKDITALCESIKIHDEWKNLHKPVLAWVHSLKALEITVDKNIRKKVNTSKITEEMYVILQLFRLIIEWSTEIIAHLVCICSRKRWTNMLQCWNAF